MTVEQWWNEKRQALQAQAGDFKDRLATIDTSSAWAQLSVSARAQLPAFYRSSIRRTKWGAVFSFKGLKKAPAAARALRTATPCLMIPAGSAPSREAMNKMLAVPSSETGALFDEREFGALPFPDAAMLTVDVETIHGPTAVVSVFLDPSGRQTSWAVHPHADYLLRGCGGSVAAAYFAKQLAEDFPKLATLVRDLRCLRTREERKNALESRAAVATERLATLEQARKAWSRIALPDDQVIELLRTFDLFLSGDAAAPHGLLLYGPPGTGKTMIAKTIAATSGCEFIPITLADVKKPNLGESGQVVKAVWARARAAGRAILFVDECDSIFARRGSAETDVVATDVVQAFLGEWNDAGSKVLVVGATNRRDAIDDAVTSRFDCQVELSLPGEHERLRILAAEMDAIGYVGSIPAEVGRLTQGFSGRNLASMARRLKGTTYPAKPQYADFVAAAKVLRASGNTTVDADASWNNLVLDQGTMLKVKTLCSLLKEAEEWKKRGVTIPTGMLLSGPPGVGKTQIARTIANEAGLGFIGATTADLKGNFLGHSANRVQQVFQRARSQAPCILFIDELDVVAGARGENDPLNKEIVGQILNEIDGIRRQDVPVFLLAATNYPEAVDAAVLSRLPGRLDIPLPDTEARGRILQVLLAGKKAGFEVSSGAAQLAEDSEGMSGRDLKNWIAAAEQAAIARAMAAGGPDHFALTLEDFSEARYARVL